ncbi:uncharacterized protein DSM5745_09345 [Aspergillus mulundensis]|uniref:Integral membrane protein n=1 Tax=Aspergillus mulundensis TaxID=1810919 RepID=A0A3D8R0B2_9EURO|nr:hypothetical protein DSM5745_09345 [Aspergillus mulundensis]RDW67479.1 hypothetical protein DSM5745_09345 [Aspergillus mulundensis]
MIGYKGWDSNGFYIVYLSKTADWLKGLADFILTAVLMLPIYRIVKGHNTLKVPRRAVVGVLAVLWICTLSIGTRLALYTVWDDYRSRLAIAHSVLVTTRNSMTVLCVALCSLVMLSEMARRMHLHNWVAQTTLRLLIFFQLGGNLLELGYTTTNHRSFGWNTTLLSATSIQNKYPRTLGLALAIVFFSHFFYAGAVLCALYAISSAEICSKCSYSPVPHACQDNNTRPELDIVQAPAQSVLEGIEHHRDDCSRSPTVIQSRWNIPESI